MNKCLVTKLKVSISDNTLPILGKIVLQATSNCDWYFRTTYDFNVDCLEGTFTDGSTTQYIDYQSKACRNIAKDSIICAPKDKIGAIQKASGAGNIFSFKLLHNNALNYIPAEAVYNLNCNGFTMGYLPECKSMYSGADQGVTNINISEFTSKLKPKLTNLTIYSVSSGSLKDLGNVTTLTTLSLRHNNDPLAIEDLCNLMVENGRKSGTLSVITSDKVTYNGAVVGYNKTVNITFEESGYSVSIL